VPVAVVRPRVTPRSLLLDRMQVVRTAAPPHDGDSWETSDQLLTPARPMGLLQR
jgi:hypothetical protein